MNTNKWPHPTKKARKLASDFGVENFSASYGWVNKFWIRHDIMFWSVCGESGDVIQDIVNDWKTRMQHHYLSLF